MLLALLLCAGLVVAEVETVSSGVFRGSMRHIVTLDGVDTVSNVAAGDYLSFRFPDGNYLGISDVEDLDVYIRRFDESRQLMNFDVGSEKFLEVNVGDERMIDIDLDGVDDAYIAFTELDRRATFVVRSKDALIEVVDEPVEDIPAEEELVEVVDPVAEVVEDVPEVMSDSAYPDPGPRAEPERKKGWFTRVLEWFARLF